jgi:hypothetical protein
MKGCVWLRYFNTQEGFCLYEYLCSCGIHTVCIVLYVVLYKVCYPSSSCLTETVSSMETWVQSQVTSCEIRGGGTRKVTKACWGHIPIFLISHLKIFLIDINVLNT